ncbi:MarR family transcriptional regulator, partial [Lactobacillus sp.]|uniref:MarR family transcriptional regulator n=1 Tax=Lactobacillus sp. TaxID=1591 RepID=UPI003EFE46BA
MTMLLHKVYHAEFKDMQLTRESGGLLYAIKTTKFNQTELARLFHITQASLSGRIKRLERDGYLIRVTDP